MFDSRDIQNFIGCWSPFYLKENVVVGDPLHNTLLLENLLRILENKECKVGDKIFSFVFSGWLL